MCQLIEEEAPQVCEEIDCPLCSMIACVHTEYVNKEALIETAKRDGDAVTIMCKTLSAVTRCRRPRHEWSLSQRTLLRPEANSIGKTHFLCGCNVRAPSFFPNISHISGPSRRRSRGAAPSQV